MKRFTYLFIFLILSGAGFYFGSQSSIPGFFTGVDSRGPASPQTQLQEAFSHAGFKDQKGLVSLITAVESEPFCDVIDNVLSYKATVEAENHKESGEAVFISVKGDCGRGDVVIFDRSICDTEPESLRTGFETENGFSVRATNLFVPVDKVEGFFLSALEVTYRDGSQEMVGPSLGEIKLSFSCASN
ncbi:MAG: hypothetical protein ACRBBP_06240 [Bdellovibrionales bacterium]